MNNDDRAKFEALTDSEAAAMMEYHGYSKHSDCRDLVHAAFGLGAERMKAFLASAQAASAEPVVDARSLNWTQAAPKTMLSPDHWQEAFYEDAGAVLYFRAANEDVPHAQRIINLLATPAPAVAPAAVTEALRKLVEMARTSGDDAEPDAELMAACDEASDILAALATRTPEPQAERHLSKAEQGALRRALMRSAKFVDQEPQPDSRGQAREGWIATSESRKTASAPIYDERQGLFVEALEDHP